MMTFGLQDLESFIFPACDTTPSTGEIIGVSEIGLACGFKARVKKSLK